MRGLTKVILGLAVISLTGASVAAMEAALARPAAPAPPTPAAAVAAAAPGPYGLAAPPPPSPAVVVAALLPEPEGFGAPVQLARVPGTRCTVAADVCVDAAAGRAWLLEGGRVIRGPVPIRPGGAAADATPAGMYWVRFTGRDDGRGDLPVPPEPVVVLTGWAADPRGPDSADPGIHLVPADADACYELLRTGDLIQVVD